MGLLYPSFLLEPISRGNHFFGKKTYLLFSKFKIGSWKRGWSQVTFLDEGGIADIIRRFVFVS